MGRHHSQDRAADLTGLRNLQPSRRTQRLSAGSDGPTSGARWDETVDRPWSDTCAHSVDNCSHRQLLSARAGGGSTVTVT